MQGAVTFSGYLLGTEGGRRRLSSILMAMEMELGINVIIFVLLTLHLLNKRSILKGIEETGIKLLTELLFWDLVMTL